MPARRRFGVLRPGRRAAGPTGLAQAHGYDTASWWTAAISAGGAITAAALLRSSPLARRSTPGPLDAGRCKLPPTRAAAGALRDYLARPETGGQVAGD